MKFGHGGHIRNLARLAGCRVEELLDFSANINPLGPPDCLGQVIARRLGEVAHYPDPQCLELRQALAEHHAVAIERIVCGNGSTELLYALPRVLAVARAVIPVPCYIDYATAAVRAGLTVVTTATKAENGFACDWTQIEAELDGREMVIVGQPGNPSGAMFDPEDLLRIARRHPSVFFVVDEAFADFAAGYCSPAATAEPNVLFLRSLTKFYAIPGLRLGYLLAAEPIAGRAAEMLPPWSVGSLAQAAGAAVLKDRAYAEKTREQVALLREQLRRGLENLEGLKVFPSPANYLLVRLEKSDGDAAELARGLLARRIAVRVCDNYAGLDNRYFRVAVRTAPENERLLDALGFLWKRKKAEEVR